MARLRNFKLTRLITISVGVVFVLGAILNISLVTSIMRRQNLREAEAKAQLLLDRNLAVHTYFSKIMKPRLLEWTAPHRDREYFEPSWMSSTYAVREIQRYFSSFNPHGYSIKDAAIDARSPENEADDFERVFLERLNRGEKSESLSEVRTIGGRPYLAVMRKGEVVEPSCLLCHGDPQEAPRGLVNLYGAERSFHRRAGDVASVVSMRIPLTDAYAEGWRTTALLSILLTVSLGLLFGVQVFIYRRFFLSPLHAVRDKARAIAGSQERLGETIEISAGSEFGDLADAFNEMSRKLRIGMDHLEERVVERTRQIDAANGELKRAIDEHRKTELALRESEARWRLSIENMLEGYALHEAIFDRNGRMVDYRFLEFNPAAQRIANVSREAIVGRRALELYPHVVERGLMDRYAEVMATGHPATISDFYYKGDNLDKALDIFCFRIDGRHFVCVFREITELKRAEAGLRASLVEKETLLKEIHHRVKNNLQLVSSLLGLQSGALRDGHSLEIFQECRQRVRIMADIHTMLYQSANLARVDFSRFIEELAGRLRQTYLTAGTRVEIHVDTADLALDVERSIPAGLILNELLSNALKHAFPEGREGRIDVKMTRADGLYTLMVRDDGIGFPAAVDFRNPVTLGLELVHLLVGQINGTIDLWTEAGTSFTIAFPAENQKG